MAQHLTYTIIALMFANVPSKLRKNGLVGKVMFFL
jgi:hypothetical protein